VTYPPRRGHFVTTIRIEDLEEIYELRSILEARAARQALETFDEPALARINITAPGLRQRGGCRRRGRRARGQPPFSLIHFAILDSPDKRRAMRLIRLLSDSTESYRAL
jgi:DNA-binding GntR family transcriptional regulator